MPLDRTTAGPEGLYRPPAPVPTTPVRALLKGILSSQRDLLSLMPDEAYRVLLTEVGRTRRKIVLVNDPTLVRQILTGEAESFPKNDLMVGALQPLVGDSIFVSSGETWRRQRRMIEAAFSHMQVSRAFRGMAAAVADFERRLDTLAECREAVSLETAMSHLTADIIYRTIFSVSLESQAAREIFKAFARFQDSVANVQILRLWLGRPWAAVKQPRSVVQASMLIRRHLGSLIDARLDTADRPLNDIAGEVIAARDPETGEGFSREELIDQIGVFFLAGHETTAGALAWAFFILSQRPEAAARIRAEVESVCAQGPIGFEATKRLTFVRNVFRETLRLYPPLAFIPRVALEPGRIGALAVPRGAMIMISPWIMHRHRALWRNPEHFDPDRFLPEREQEWTQSAYLPFGAGRRLCVGAAFATVESTLILARLIRRYEVEAVDPRSVRPVTRLTTRSAQGIRVRFRRR
ncbi:MAG: cytochrome P450 [Kiloniellales bacterium]|nr:cytochrome P450 [Kiloniellales bacterium]